MLYKKWTVNIFAKIYSLKSYSQLENIKFSVFSFLNQFFHFKQQITSLIIIIPSILVHKFIIYSNLFSFNKLLTFEHVILLSKKSYI